MELIAETKYRLLAQIFHEIRDTLDLEEILNHLLDMVYSVLEYDAVGIFVLNQHIMDEPHKKIRRGLIDGIAIRGFDIRPPSIDPMLSLGKGIVGHVIRNCESVVASDVRRDSRYVAGRKGTRSEIAVPIEINNRAIGALNLESDRLGAYSHDNLEILQFFADAAALAIEKAILHRQIMEKERIEKQLEVAHEVQSRLLPADPPYVPGYDIAGTCISTNEIGGDYYDYLRLPGDRIGTVIADVSGQGIPAALIMTAFRALLRTQVQRDPRPEHIAAELRGLLPEFIGEYNFVTTVYGVLNPPDGRFAYVNCGHNPPMLFRTDGSIEQLRIGGTVLSGAIVDLSYHAFEIGIAPGDLLLFYTDGVIEVESGKGEQFGMERLEMAVRRSLELPASGIIEKLIGETREFSGSENYEDDFTLMIVRRKQVVSTADPAESPGRE